MSEAPISDRFDQAVRLTGLLRKILDDVHRSIKVLKEAVEGSSLPYVQVDHGDIELAALYLRDLGFKNDGKHLYRAYWQLSNKCIDEWLAGMADGESQEFQRDQLIELFGQFPRKDGPNDPTVADRRTAIFGYAVQFSNYLSGLISSVNASENRRPSGTPEDRRHGAGTTSNDAPEDGLCSEGRRLVWGGIPFMLTTNQAIVFQLLVDAYPSDVLLSEFEDKGVRTLRDSFRYKNAKGQNEFPHVWYLIAPGSRKDSKCMLDPAQIKTDPRFISASPT